MESTVKILLILLLLTKKIKVLFTRKYLRHSIHSTGIFEMCTKKINIFKDIKLENFNSFTAFFSIYKNHYFIYAQTRLDSWKIVLSWRIKDFKKRFRGGSHEKIGRMWLRQEFLWLAFLPSAAAAFKKICYYDYVLCHLSSLNKKI